MFFVLYVSGELLIDYLFNDLYYNFDTISFHRNIVKGNTSFLHNFYYNISFKWIKKLERNYTKEFTEDLERSSCQIIPEPDLYSYLVRSKKKFLHIGCNEHSLESYVALFLYYFISLHGCRRDNLDEETAREYRNSVRVKDSR